LNTFDALAVQSINYKIINILALVALNLFATDYTDFNGFLSVFIRNIRVPIQKQLIGLVLSTRDKK